ncbi:MAG: aminoglycoside 3-N-acetyltransferase [Rhodospirillales bacterium]|nr:aminoglycoside 3-N-acetyltransferase [Rhodospirillales bacterium]
MTPEARAVAAILPQGAAADVLIVHSAFSGLSRAGLKAEAFCQALIEAAPACTILMPTMTWRTVTPATPTFDEIETPSHTGILTEVFRTRFASHRSLHPTHSVAGRGPLAARLLGSHHLGDTPCPGSSPYGLMRDFDASILLLGVGLECCTAIHHAEETIAPDFYVRPPAEGEAYRLRARDGTLHQVQTRRHRRLPRDFSQFEPALRTAGHLREGEVAGTVWRVLPARQLYRLVLAALAERQDATLAPAARETAS